MALDKPGKYWRIRITAPNGRRIQKSTRTTDKKQAQQLEAKITNDLWRHHKLGEKRQRTWKEAVIRWIKESADKKSIDEDRRILDWCDKYLGHLNLDQIDRDCLENMAISKEKEKVAPATVNRHLEVVRAIMRRAMREWEWLDKVPAIRMRKKPDGRVRWITREEADRLIANLPPHLAAMAAFSLATGLRESNVMNLKWKNVDMVNRHATIHASEAKAGRHIPIPLNDDAIAILRQQLGKHQEYVFVYRSAKGVHPVQQCNTKAFKNALRRANIENFRWHDLRHTWASWHVQNGTSLHELMQLGGWASYQMVLRYAHLSSHQLQAAADRITGSKLVRRELKVVGGNC